MLSGASPCGTDAENSRDFTVVVRFGKRTLPYSRLHENLFRLKAMESTRAGIEHCKTYSLFKTMI
jgi:hypothetical protein